MFAILIGMELIVWILQPPLPGSRKECSMSPRFSSSKCRCTCHGHDAFAASQWSCGVIKNWNSIQRCQGSLQIPNSLWNRMQSAIWSVSRLPTGGEGGWEASGRTTDPIRRWGPSDFVVAMSLKLKHPIVTMLPHCEVVDIPMVKHRHVPTVVKQQKVGGVGPWVATGMACDAFWNRSVFTKESIGHIYIYSIS